MKRFFLLCYCILAAVAVSAEHTVPVKFRHIGISEGLPDNYVKNVFGLPDGRLGVRTTELLSLYDGKNFVSFPLWKSEPYPVAQRASIPVQYIDAKKRLWLKERGGLRIFNLDTECFMRADTIFRRWGLDDVSNLFVDSEKLVWVTDAAGRIYLLDSADERVRVVCDVSDFLKKNGPLLTVASKGAYSWMVHESGVMRCYDHRTGKFVRQENFLQGRLAKGAQVLVCMLDNGDFWLVWNYGGGFYSNAVNTWTELPLSAEHFEEIAALDVDRSGSAWIGTSGQGIYIVDRHTLMICRVNSFNADLRELNVRGGVHSIYCDNYSGTVWIGMFNQGLAFHHPSMDNFTLYNNRNLSGNFADESIHCMVEEREGAILMGTSRGLYRYSCSDRTIDMPYPELSGQLFRVAYKDNRDRIWLGTFRNGLYCIENGRVKHYLGKSNIRAMVADFRGRLWVSRLGTVGMFVPESDSIVPLAVKFPKISKYRVANSLAIDSKERIVVGADNGFYIYDTEKDSVFAPERDAPGSPLQTLGSNKFNCIFLDSRGLLWMGTQYGIKIVSDDFHVDYLGEEAGFTNLTVQSIQEDNNGDVWVSTINGLYKITVENEGQGYTYCVVCLDRNRSHSWNDLFEFCSLKTADGQLCFGRMDGFYLFSPENVVLAPSSVPPMFTGFRLFNEPVVCGEQYNGRVLFEKTVDRVRYAELRHDENFITFEFSSLNFVNPSQTYFRYKMEGVDKEWIELLPEKGQASVAYNHLPPGKYIFHVMSAGNDHHWSDRSSFVVVIRPPFWATVWAGVFYLVCLLALGYFIVRYLHIRSLRKLKRMQEVEAERQREELNQMKFRFFINVSHELRTPLTLILTPLEVILKKVTDERLKDQLRVVYKNTQELYRLINQLLDFRKVEMKREKLNLLPGDLEEFLRTVYEGFRPFAVDKGIDFDLNVAPAHWYMNFDHDKLHKIVNNLLSNAFKFTPESGRVTLSLAENEYGGRKYACISVSDTGIGIASDQVKHIFERFYQVQHNGQNKVGSGIGLHLVKEYVDMHQGSVHVSSEPGKGSCFTVFIPTDLAVAEETGMQDVSADAKKSGGERSVQEAGKKKLLVADDNNDFRNFLKEQLSEEYQVFDAPDGEAAEKLAAEQNPDLIISDVMMPNVDGIELCRRIKTNMETSHIPIILLTARTSDDLKINGYSVGADSYMAKPFNMDMLRVRIRKLIEKQEMRKKDFQRSVEVNPASITITSLDEQIIKRALGCIENNMDNTSYNVEALSSDMGMSRMNLYRKLQSITGQTPTEFIRAIRLKRAAQLLESSQLTISEVADRVGFSSSSYFSKCFKEQFGMLPTQYQEEKNK